MPLRHSCTGHSFTLFIVERGISVGTYLYLYLHLTLTHFLSLSIAPTCRYLQSLSLSFSHYNTISFSYEVSIRLYSLTVSLTHNLEKSFQVKDSISIHYSWAPTQTVTLSACLTSWNLKSHQSRKIAQQQ